MIRRAQIQRAIEDGQPFTIMMADGKDYEVPHRDFISLPPRGAFVIAYDPESETGEYNMLSMMTMTGLRRKDSSIVREEPEEG